MPQERNQISLSLSPSPTPQLLVPACSASAAIGARPSRSPEHSQFIDKNPLLLPTHNIVSIFLCCYLPICCTSGIASQRLLPIRRFFSSSTSKIPASDGLLGVDASFLTDL